MTIKSQTIHHNDYIEFIVQETKLEKKEGRNNLSNKQQRI